MTSAGVWALPARSAAEQASQPSSPAAGQLDAGENDTCAVLSDGNLDCWGYNGEGELGYGNTDSVGDDETPASVGPVDFGAGRTVKAVSAGTYHTCALLDDGAVRCWGYGADGRLGYGNPSNVSSPASVGPVDLGGAKATAISAGGGHTCAIRADGSVVCWGYGFEGELGYDNPMNLGDVSTPGSQTVDLGGAKATAISAGGLHTCAILQGVSGQGGPVRCWGFGVFGQLGYGNTLNVGDGPNADGSMDPSPDFGSPVYLGPGRAAVAISAGASYTCAILDNGSVLCWGNGAQGQLGYGNTDNVGAKGYPGLIGPVDLGGRTAKAISAGDDHTCAILDNGSVLCWGDGSYGELGYGNTNSVGDAQTPASAGPVDLGPGRTAVAISSGGSHTCALLDDGSVRCWGYGAYGQLGYCSTSNVGDVQTPAAAGPVNLQAGDDGASCASPAAATPATPATPQASSPPATPKPSSAAAAAAAAAEAARARALRGCLAAVRARARRALSARSSKRRRSLVKRQERTGRLTCLRRYGRTPGAITGLRALVRGKSAIELDFSAPGTDGEHPPPARSYLVKQSLHPIRTERDFVGAGTLCAGACRFAVTQVGGRIALTVTHLQANRTYYYAVAARDNVSGRLGPRSRTVEAKTA
jgi:alpha-tubulin suppressor-like RCC1 family protein